MSGDRSGFVVACVSRSIPGLTTYWYGPDHGWGTTSGGRDDYAVATFTSRNAAEAKRRGYKIVSASRSVVSR